MWAEVSDFDGAEAVVVTEETPDGWVITAVFVEQEQALVLRELSVNPRSGMPDGGLAISRLRSLGSLKAEARRALDRYRKPLASPIGYEPPLGARSPAMREPWPGRRRDERDYAELAIGYEALIREGSNEPVLELARRYGFTRPQMRDLLHRARVLGFLTPPPRHGVRGGAATEKAHAVLAQATGEPTHPPG